MKQKFDIIHNGRQVYFILVKQQRLTVEFYIIRFFITQGVTRQEFSFRN